MIYFDCVGAIGVKTTKCIVMCNMSIKTKTQTSIDGSPTKLIMHAIQTDLLERRAYIIMVSRSCL